MADQPKTSLWDKLRKQSRKDLDKVEKSLVMGADEKREYAGDPAQPRHFWIRTRNK
jgi:hypothetical protein